jgi:hypothetical protein
MPVPIMFATTMQVAVRAEIDFGLWYEAPELTARSLGIARDGVNADASL